MERQNFLDGLAHPVIQSEGDSGLRFLLTPLQFESQLEKK